MFHRSSRWVLLSGVVLSMVAVSACATEGGGSVREQVAAAIPTTAIAAAPTTAVMRGATTARPTSTHAAKGSRASASASHVSASAAGPAVGVPAAATSGAAVYGFSAPELLLNQSTQGDDLKAMKAIGVTSVRLEANWYGMQP